MGIDIITNVCTDMASEGSSSSAAAAIATDVLISMDRSDDSLETSPPSPQDVSQEPEPRISYDTPDSEDIGPDPYLNVARGRSRYTGIDLQLAQQRAIRTWLGPRYPEYATSARRLRSFQNDRWSTEGKPSSESLVEAGYFYDGESQILNFGDV